jgi:cysteine desulfurase family protein
MMVYLDNAATTFPKPRSVQEAVAKALYRFGANPGRAGHQMSLSAAEEVYRCRCAAADFFHAPGPECVSFTLNCTHAANCVLKGLLKPGDHVVISCLEHNAIMRPLHALAETGVEFSEAQVVPGDNDQTVDAFRKALKENTKLVFCIHASNVWGIRLPVERITALAHEYGISMAVDCAQTAGVFPINLADSGIDYLCVAGHKGLYGPMGTGMLITPHGSELKTIIEGGTGTKSAIASQPSEMPERMESGTPNMPGIAGLHAGIQFVQQHGPQNICQHETKLLCYLHEEFSRMARVHLYTHSPDIRYYAPVLSFNLDGIPSEEVGRELDHYGIAVRAGLHCAPAAHRFMGTLDTGAVRVCPSYFTTKADIYYLISSVRKILTKNYKRNV